MRTIYLLISLLLLICIVGCFGCSSALSLTTIQPTPLSLMTAQVSPRVAYLVIDNNKIPNEIPVLVAGEDRGGKLVDLHEFVRRDLSKAFSNYFREVNVISSLEARPAEPHIVIDVKVDRVEVLVTNKRQNGMVTVNSGYASMTWGLAIRPSEAQEYIYSYAGNSPGAPASKPAFLFRSMLESAIAGMLEGYTEKKIQQVILELPTPAAPATMPQTGV